MRKLFALYTNEMIKISRKISIIIIMGIMILVVVGMGGLVKLMEYLNTNNAVTTSIATSQKQNMDQQLVSLRSQLADVTNKLKTASLADDPALKSQQDSLQQQIDMYNYAVNNDIVIGSSSYRANALTMLYNYKSTAAQFGSIPDAALTADQKAELTQANDYVTRLQNVVDNKDFSGYIAVSNEIIDRDKTLSADEKQIKKDSNDLRLKLNLTGENVDNLTGYDAAQQIVTTIENDKLSLLNNVDTTGSGQYGSPLTSQRRQDINNDIAVNTYKLDNHIGFTDSGAIDYKSSAMPAMFSLGGILLIILMLILAGGSVSQEISTGSIKSLIIAPARRWKIFTAKFLSLLTVLILSGLVVYLVSSVTYGAFFGFSSGAPYVFGINGTAHVMNFYVYNLAYLYAGLIMVLVYTVLAFMLSIITRNTAAAVGISMGVYFGGGIVNSLLLTFASGEWLKFSPFSNMDITSKIFPGAAASITGVSTGAANTVNNTLTFSLCYLAVLLLCMGYAAFDSFTRRDIK